MKWNILLLIVGTALGAWAGIVLGGQVLELMHGKSAGTEFESLADLREQIGKRDERDELGDKSVSLRSIMQAHPSDEIIYTLVPNLNVKFQGVPLTTNSHGMRGPEIAVEKPEGTFRIALLGDSFAFGWGVEEEQIFARALERELSARWNGRKVEVLNFGVPGYSTFQEVALFMEKGRAFKPDAVLIYFVENDFGLPFFIRNLQDDGKLSDSVSYVRRFWKKQDDAISAQKRSFWKLLNPNTSIQKLYTELEKTNTPLFIAINPRKGWKKDAKRLYVFRKNKNITQLRLRRWFMTQMAERNIDPKSLSLPTDPHPSALKHAMLGEVLAEKIATNLSREKKRKGKAAKKAIQAN